MGIKTKNSMNRTNNIGNFYDNYNNNDNTLITSSLTSPSASFR